MEEDINYEFTNAKDECLKRGQIIRRQKLEIDELKIKNKELKNSLIDMVNQFTYEDNNPKTKGSSLEKLYTGGLSALEDAFNILNIDEGIERGQLWKLSKD